MTDERRIDEFSERLDALGPEIERWPDHPASEARALLAVSPEARARHATARRLAGLVAEAARAETPNGFAFRVVAEVAARRSDRLGWLTGSPRRLGFASMGLCAAALAIGVALGSVSQSAQADSGGLDIGEMFSITLADGDL
jgi:hypothetical protein